MDVLRFPERPLVMGILNVTPDSFFDGGSYVDGEAQARRAAQMVREGADIIDVGGESTRPGSAPVSESEERVRVLPAVRALAARCGCVVSVDTTKPAIADEALAAGAAVVNDVSMLRDADLAKVAAAHGAVLIVMHTRGTPATMRDLAVYTDVVAEVRDELLCAVDKARSAGVAKDRIWIDPGIGFAKTAQQSAALVAATSVFADTGYPVLVGPSRKSFIGELTGAPVEDRLPGTLAAVTAAVMGGARAVRVHDVGPARQAADVAWAMARHGGGRG